MPDHGKTVVFLFGIAPEADIALPPGCGIIVTDSLALEQRLIGEGRSAHYLYRDSTAAFEAAKQYALQWLAEFPSRRVSGGKTIEAVFSDKDLPLWRFCYDALFEIRGGIFETLLHIALLADLLDRQQTAAATIHAVRGNALAEILARILESRRIPAQFTWHKAASAPHRRVSFLSLILKRIHAFILCRALVCVRRLYESRSGKKRLALVCSMGDMGRIYRDKTGKKCIGDMYFGKLEPALWEAYPDLVRIGISTPAIHSAGWRNCVREWGMILGGSYRPWHSYATLRDLLSALRAKRKFKAVLADLQADPAFLALFHYGNVDFGPMLKPLFATMLPGQFAATGLHVAIARRMMRAENIGMVISSEAFSNLGRVLALAAHENEAELWGMQAGIISPEHITNIGFYAAALGGHTQLLPDRFFVWGERYREILMGYGVSTDRLVTMGMSRAPVLPVKAAGIPRQILYLTGGNALVCPYLMTIEEEFYTLRVLADNLPAGAELVVRTHPRHEAADYERCVAGHKNVRVVSAHRITLEESLSDASCVVAKASTVLLEAANAGKPAIVINLAGTPDFTGFSADRMSLPYVTDAASLRMALTDALDGERQAPTGFRERWCSGDAASAVACFMENLREEVR